MNVRTTEIKDCCDQTAPHLLERLVEAKLATLIASLSQQTELNSDNVANTVSLLNGALAELKELKEWKRSEENKNGIILICFLSFYSYYSTVFTASQNYGTILFQTCKIVWMKKNCRY